MTCKKLRTKALWEQDRWLGYLPVRGDPNIFDTTTIRRIPTHQERMDFLHYDSHGGYIPAGNIIMIGKLAARAVGDTGWFSNAAELLEIYLDPARENEWPGGFALMEDYLWRVCGIAPLRKAFGDEIVRRWLAAFLWHAFSFPDLVWERENARFYRR